MSRPELNVDLLLQREANLVCANVDLTARVAELESALKAFAWIDETTPSNLWAIDKTACAIARAALAKVSP
jgi:hypothetical protein